MTSARDITTDFVAHPFGRHVLWLGAGFSRCLTMGKAPLMFDFFDSINSAQYPRATEFLNRTYANPKLANVEQVLAILDQLDESPLSSALTRNLLGGQDPRAIKAEIGLYLICRLSFNNISVSPWLTDYLLSSSSRDTYITTNYDVLAESLLSIRRGATHCVSDPSCHHCRMRYCLLHNCECDSTTPKIQAHQGSILKLHGSIAWHICQNRGCCSHNCLQPACDFRPCLDPKCRSCGYACLPAVVLPSMTKKFSTISQISRMWDCAAMALAEAETITVIGFSFPQSDIMIQRVLRSEITTNRRARTIRVLDLNPQPVINTLRELLGTDTATVFEGYPVPREYITPDWYNFSDPILDGPPDPIRMPY